MRSMNQTSLLNYFNIVKPKLTERETRVLEAIEELQPCRLEDVAVYMRVPEHTISGRITGLVKKHQIITHGRTENSRGSTVNVYIPKDAHHEYPDTQ